MHNDPSNLNSAIRGLRCVEPRTLCLACIKKTKLYTTTDEAVHLEIGDILTVSDFRLSNNLTLDVIFEIAGKEILIGTKYATAFVGNAFCDLFKRLTEEGRAVELEESREKRFSSNMDNKDFGEWS